MLNLALQFIIKGLGFKSHSAHSCERFGSFNLRRARFFEGFSSNLKFLQFFFFFSKVFLILSDIVFERQEVVIKLKRIYNEFSY